MPIAGSTSDFSVATTNGSATPSIALPTSVPSGALIVLGIEEYGSEARTINSVAGGLNASGWTLVSGPTDANATTIRSWLYVRENSAAGNETITVTFDAACNSRLVAGFLTGARSSGGAEAVATPTNTSGANFTTTALSASGAGALIGFVVTNNTVTLSSLGTNEVDLNPSAYTGHIVYEPYASAGSYSLQASLATSAIVVHSAAFLEAEDGGGGGFEPAWARNANVLIQ